MAKPVNAFEVLEMLRKKTGTQDRKFSELSHYLDAKAREKGVPLSGQFELTPLCNLDCKMCYVHLTPEQMGGQSPLPAAVWKALIRQAWDAGMLTATLTGGECLAYPGCEELYLYLHSLGCEVNLLTNGTLLDAERIRFLQAHMPARLRITLYGWNDDVYERVTGQRVFGAVAGNIRRAVEAGLPVSVSLTPNRFLGDDAPETLRTAYSLCRSVDVNACIYPPRAETGRSGQQDDPEIELYMRVYLLQNELLGVPPVELDAGALPPCGGPSHTTSERGLRCGAGRSR